MSAATHYRGRMDRDNPSARSQPARAQVFVVEDDDAVRDSLCVLIEASGRAVREFSSAQAFLDAVEADVGDGRNCLILDNNMPGLTGIELLESLRRKGWRLPVIMITGGQSPGLSERIARADRAVCLEKPIDPNALLSAVDRALGNT